MTENQAGPDATATMQPTGTEPVAIGATGGMRALVGAAVAIIGVLAAVNPDSVVLRALNQAMPQLAEAVPTVITACGAVLAAFSQPPKLLRRRTSWRVQANSHSVAGTTPSYGPTARTPRRDRTQQVRSRATGR